MSMKEIELLKELTGESSEIKLKYFIGLSNKMIENYLNDKNFKSETYQMESIKLAEHLINESKSKGVTSQSQGERSMSYQAHYQAIPESIRVLLPMPMARSI